MCRLHPQPGSFAISRNQAADDLGEPTLAQVMRRPFWIFALLLAMLVAAVFAWLGQWQMGNAVRVDADHAYDTETPIALSEVASPAEAVNEPAAGRVVEVSGTFAPHDYVIVEQRMNQGENGYWVVGNLLTDASETSAHLAVAIGWAPDRATAERAITEIASDAAFGTEQHLEGRYMPTEGVSVPSPDEDPFVIDSMAPEQLVNVWSQIDGAAFAGFLVAHAEPAAEIDASAYGLSVIDSVPPEPPEKISWLNVFYAIEWVVFAGFALFFWYRLARDAWEKEHELKLQEESQPGSAEGADTPESAAQQ